MFEELNCDIGKLSTLDPLTSTFILNTPWVGQWKVWSIFSWNFVQVCHYRL